MQRAHQAEVPGDRPHARHDRALREGEHEHARDQERDVHVPRHAPGRLQDDAEDEEVHGRVQQRGGHLPELPELRLAVLGRQLRLGEGQDEVPASPELPDVLDESGAGTAHGQPVLGGELCRREACVGRRARAHRDSAVMRCLTQEWKPSSLDASYDRLAFVLRNCATERDTYPPRDTVRGACACRARGRAPAERVRSREDGPAGSAATPYAS